MDTENFLFQTQTYILCPKVLSLELETKAKNLIDSIITFVHVAYFQILIKRWEYPQMH